MLFQKSVVGNSRLANDQWLDVQFARNAFNAQQRVISQSLRASGVRFGNERFMVNDGLIPEDVYQEFDNVTVTEFRSDEGDAFLNDLLAMSKSVNIGKIVHKFRQSSDAGRTQTSMSGQIGVKFDQVEYTIDGSIIPIHDTGFYREWREWNAQRSENFDGLIDDQRESVRSLRQKLADNFIEGHTDVNGNFIKIDGIDWQGMRNDSRVAAVDVGAGGINFDFTDTTKTFAEIEAAFKQVRDVLWITNNCEMEVTYYVSKAIASNWERNSSEFSSSENKILQRLAALQGVKEIKTTSKLVGEELMGFPHNQNAVRPIVGMGVNTVAMPRPLYNSNYEFAVWAAIGFEVRTDFGGQTCAIFVSDLT